MRCDGQCERCGRCIPASLAPDRRAIKPKDRRHRDDGRLVADIGTTTIRLRAVDLTRRRVYRTTTVFNPHLRFGSDILSRISRWREVRRIPLTGLLKWFLRQNGIDARRTITVVGNTTMMHFLFDRNPRGLGAYPYRSALPLGRVLTFRKNSLTLRTLPVLGPFLGSDCTAAIIGSGINRSRKLTLLVDAGTNGEVVLGNRERIVACSTAAGPAFEGATLECGSLAQPGAITACRFQNGRWLIKTIGAIQPTGICGSGVVDVIAEGVNAGLIGYDGRIKSGPVLALNGTGVYLTQADVRAVQLAKAAIATGIKILLKEWGGKPIERIIITGRFGDRLRIDSAVAIGLLPDVAAIFHQEPDLALKGATRCVLQPELLKETEDIARICESVPLAEQEDFERLFVTSMEFSRWHC